MWGWITGSNSNNTDVEDDNVVDAEENMSRLSVSERDNPDASPSEPESATSPTVDNALYATDSRKPVSLQRIGCLPPLIFRSWGGYTEDDLADMVIRGPNFLQDKIKIAAGPSIYRLAHADIFSTNKDEARVTHVAQRPDAYVEIMKQKRQAYFSEHKIDATAHTPFRHHLHELSPTLIINIVFPGPKNNNMNLVMYYERRVPPAEILKKFPRSKKKKEQKAETEQKQNPSNSSRENSTSNNSNSQNDAADSSVTSNAQELSDEDLLWTGVDVSRVAAFDQVMKRFLNGSDENRDATLKIVPRVAEGGWMVKKTVGRVPAILGKKVKQVYYRKYSPETHDNYIEIDADLGTSMMAGKIISMIKTTCKGLVVDMSFILQGDSPAELPESLLGGIRMYHVDIDGVLHYNDNAKANQYPDL